MSDMPFTGHTVVDLVHTLELIYNSQMQVELFDAFLYEYAKTKDLEKAICFADLEWDC